MTVLRTFQAGLALLLTAVLSAPAPAPAQEQKQGQGRGTLSYLQKEPVTLFDIGMKRLRSAALDTALRMTAEGSTHPTSSVRYKHDAGTIEIVFDLKTENADNIVLLRQQCLDIRKSTILRMLRIGLTNYPVQLSAGERIRRRIGAQFAHESVGSAKETLSLGEQLGLITYFTVTLTTTAESAIRVSCRALVTDLKVK